ncbi:MAG: hypothetical protein NZX77_08130 [Polyangiaceae bacterium]|nr:hypothetical protein [Polyangiaceae bacterium]
MVNPPVAGGVNPLPAAPPPPEPPPVDQVAARRQMKGTIVGIAPPAVGAAPAPPETAGPGHSFAPPGGAAGVNPMGSTFVADGPPPAFPPPSPNFGGGTPFGAPQPAPEPPAASPEGLSIPPAGPGGFGAPPPGGGYQAPPTGGGYGAPVAPAGGPAGSFGAGSAQTPTPGVHAPSGAMVLAGAGHMVPAGNMGLAAPGPVGTIRNPVTTLLLCLVCFPIGCVQLKALEDELNAFVGNGKKASILWLILPLIPVLGMPQLMAEARAKAGTPVQGEGNLLYYLFFGPYMIPKDANEIWRHLGARST